MAKQLDLEKQIITAKKHELKRLETRAKNEIIKKESKIKYTDLAKLVSEIKELPSIITKQQEKYPTENKISLEEYRSMVIGLAMATDPKENSIWEQSSFYDSDTQRQSHFKPIDILKALTIYGATTESLGKCLLSQGIPDTHFVGLCARFEIIIYAKEISLSRKTEAYVSAAVNELADAKDIPDEYFELTNHGERLTMAGTSHMNNKSKLMFNLAKACERRSLNEKPEYVFKVNHKIESKSANLDVLLATDIEDLAKQL